MGMDNSILLREEVDGAIQTAISPVELALVYYPRMEQAIELAETPEEINEIRSQIDTVNTYIKRALPKFLQERRKQFDITHQGEMLYIEASRKAGAMWDAVEGKAKAGGDRQSKHSNGRNNGISVQDVGFNNPVDAMRCRRIGAELDDEDVREYSEYTYENQIHATVNGMERIWRMLQDTEIVPIDGKYRVLYADPPWSYGNTMPDYAPDQGLSYPMMTIQELCDMPVVEAAEDDAVLFMWCTSPILEEAFKVIKAWGFEYKASFVWDKVKHNMGHYNSVRHEFLLVCTRGSCQPDTIKLFDSVVSVERGKHSEKPEVFREMIDTLYPAGNRIELFARRQVEGWDAYGNEVS
jgi:N6-adenosine-specific RNA methylase IME4